MSDSDSQHHRTNPRGREPGARTAERVEMDNTHMEQPPGLQADLGREVRQSLLLLGISVAVTTVVTVAAQATVSLLG